MTTFSSKRANKPFDIDGEMFEAHGQVPADFMAQLADRLEESSKLPTQMAQYEELRQIICELLVGDSGTRFVERCGSWDNPVGLSTLHEVTSWLMEEISGRPTSPPTSSTEPPSPTSTTSTDGASAEESVPAI